MAVCHLLGPWPDEENYDLEQWEAVVSSQATVIVGKWQKKVNEFQRYLGDKSNKIRCSMVKEEKQ